MAVTRLRVPGAGERLAGRGRSHSRRELLGLLCVGIAQISGCGLAPRPEEAGAEAPRQAWPAPARFIVPVASVLGGFAQAPGSVLNIWQPLPGAFLALRAPVAAAGRGADLYIADAGHNAVFHFDSTKQTLRRLLGPGARPGVALSVLGDASLLVFDPALRRLLLLSRQGRELARLPEAALAGGAFGLAFDEPRGTIWLADATAPRLLAVRLAMNAVLPSPMLSLAGDAVGQITALAAGAGALYALEPARSRVLQLDTQGRVLRTFGALDMRQPRSIVADRHRRVYVIDASDGRLHVFRDGRRIAAFSPADFGAVEFTDLRVADDDLVVTDMRGAQVQVYRLLAEGPES